MRFAGLLRATPTLPLLCAAASAVSLYFFGMLFLFLQSNADLPWALRDVVRLVTVESLAMLAAGVAVGVLLGLLSSTARTAYVAVLGLVSLYCFVLMYLWVGDYGVIDGLPMRWEENATRGIVELVALLAVVVVAVLRRDSVQRQAPRILSLLLIAQAGYTGIALASYARGLEQASTHRLSRDVKPRFSTSKSVILILVDTASLAGFERIRNEYEGVFHDFTFYRYAIGPFCQTHPTLTAMLTGRVYDNRVDIQSFMKDAFRSQASLPLLLRNAGFVVQLYPLAPNLMYVDGDIADNAQHKSMVRVSRETVQPLTDLFLFRISPHYLKLLSRRVSSGADIRVALGQGLLATMQETETFGIAENQVPTFTYLHLFGAHPPFFYDEHLNLADLPFSEASYLRQYKGAMLLVGRILSKLKELGAYDNAMIIVAGDHGLSPLGLHGTAGRERPEDSFIDLLQQSNVPLLLIKPPLVRHDRLAVSSAPAMLSDVAKTVLDYYGIPNEASGENILAMDGKEYRERETFYFYHVSRGFAPPIWGFRVAGDPLQKASWTPTYKVTSAKGVVRTPEPGDYPQYIHWLSERLTELKRDLAW
jgi:hypothetical protein